MARGRKKGTPKTGGRQKGSRNKTTREISAIAQEYGPAALRAAAKLGGLVKDQPEASSETARIAALNIVLERAYGKAPQAITGPDGGPLKMITAITQMSEAELEELIASAAAGAPDAFG